MGKEIPENIVITGSTGFVGSHLVDYILSLPGNYMVHGLYRSSPAYLERYNRDPRLVLHQLELQDQKGLTALLSKTVPDRIFHLAAQSFPAESIQHPLATLNNNLNGTISLFEAVKGANLSARTRILNIGSGDQYGFIKPDELPVREQNPFRPGNPYAVSKITQEMLGYQYFRSFGLKIIATRTFNHLGPRQSEQLATAAFAKQIAQAEAGLIPPVIKVGNLEAGRDYTDVRDVVRGYWLALEEGKCEFGETYNLCSGTSYRMGEILDNLLSLSTVSVKVEFDAARSRPSDIPLVCGDYTRFHGATGWKPLISMNQSLQDLLDYWRSRVRTG